MVNIDYKKLFTVTIKKVALHVFDNFCYLETYYLLNRNY